MHLSKKLLLTVLPLISTLYSHARSAESKNSFPLHEACHEDDVEVVKNLIVGKANVNAVDGGRTPLYIACREGCSQVVGLLLEAKASASINAADNVGDSALHWAAYNGDISSVELLLNANANISSLNRSGGTPLYEASASKWKCSKVIALLLEAKSDPEATDKRGKTPLCIACAFGRYETSHQLIAAGANFNATTHTGETPLHLASREGSVGVQQLLAARANFHATTDAGKTPLHIASERGRIETVQQLIAAGANFHATTHAGETALHLASRYGRFEVVQQLLAAKADIQAITHTGATALHIAIPKGRTNIARTLLRELAETTTTPQ